MDNRCRHVKGFGRVQIVEEIIRTSRYVFQDGQLDANIKEPRDYNGPGKIHIECLDCGYKQTYNIHSPVLPVWVTTLLIEYIDHIKWQSKVRKAIRDGTD